MASKEELTKDQEVQDIQDEPEGKSTEELIEEYMSLLVTERQQNAELQSRYTRLAADFENFRKRTERQNRDLVIRANENLICGLLPILDNFHLALASVQDESILKGVKMIYDQFLSVLEDQGLSPIEAIGCPFDPSLHEAVASIESSEHDENIIVGEVRRGYMLGGKVLRPAMVKVNIKKEE